MVLKRSEGKYMSCYFPNDFNEEWLKFLNNVKRDPRIEEKKIPRAGNRKVSLVIRSLIVWYNKQMEEKYGGLESGGDE